MGYFLGILFAVVLGILSGMTLSRPSHTFLKHRLLHGAWGHDSGAYPYLFLAFITFIIAIFSGAYTYLPAILIGTFCVILGYNLLLPLKIVDVVVERVYHSNKASPATKQAIWQLYAPPACLYQYFNPQPIVVKTIVAALEPFAKWVPNEEGPFLRKAYDLIPDLPRTIEQCIHPMFGTWMFTHTRNRLANNLDVMTKKFLPEDKQEKGEKFTMSKFKGTKDELIYNYLRDTPFKSLFDQVGPFGFDTQERFSHQMVVAGTGSGKSYFISHMVVEDAKQGNAAIVIDPKDDKDNLINTLSHIEALKDRLIIIDPDDKPGINLFDVEVPAEGREQFLNGVFESYQYFISQLLGDELTSQMGSLLRPLVALMCICPDADIYTLIDVMDNIKPFEKYLPELPKPLRDFLVKEYEGKEYVRTKTLLRRRVYEIAGSGSFGLMFSAKKNTIHLQKWMEEGKIILIHASPNKLGGNYQTLGRYFIAEVDRLARVRDATKPCFLYVDEAGDFFDSRTPRILNQLRAARCGGLFAFQYFNQAPADVQNAMLANTAIRMFGGKNVADGRMLRDHLFASREQNMTFKRGQFLCYAGNRTFTLRVPELTAPRMEETDYRALRETNRKLLASPKREDVADLPKIEFKIESTPASSNSDDVPLC